MKVIIAGGRDFDRGDMVVHAVKQWKQLYGEITEIVCGMAQGADTMGLNYGIMWKIPVKKFFADWNNLSAPNVKIRTNKSGKKYNANAGFDRNRKMAEYAEGLIAFWDTKSHGTANMIKEARARQLKVLVVNY